MVTSQSGAKPRSDDRRGNYLSVGQLARPTAVDVVHWRIGRPGERGADVVLCNESSGATGARAGGLMGGERVTGDVAGTSFAVGAVRGIRVDKLC